MKRTLLLSLLLFTSGVIFSQEAEIEHVKIAKDSLKSNNFFPHIDHYYEGEIPIQYLGYPHTISVGKDCSISSFSISFPSQPAPVLVRGNTIPDDVVYQISKQCLGQMIFITNIVAFDKNNEMIHVKPMTLVPIK